MYYMQPVQLTQYFSRMEEDNLFLMQRCQETEVMFEEIKARLCTRTNALPPQLSRLGNSRRRTPPTRVSLSVPGFPLGF